ncbi:MAG: ATP-binding protein [Bacteroidetes bacterium]|nr:ATP-binding protein [Bacteroidota bacterium]
MNIDQFKQYEGEDAIPHAGSMIESFRSIGYSLETAIADIIDNSIAARAKNVWIDFDWRGSETFIVITDDGDGMSIAELVNAMRPGSKNPLADRGVEDLGRFGLGLKTASFSQCRNLTVATKKKDSDVVYRCWNLDYVSITGEWKLLNYLQDLELLARINELNKGTVVIWQHIDRLVAGTDVRNEEHLNYFLDKIKNMEKHLQMVFHQYLEKSELTIWIRDRKITHWDPYLKSNPHSEIFTNNTLRDQIQVTAYILPHHAKLTKEEFDNGSWIKGWNAHQGFYVYRNGRMIISGEWLGMYKQEEHNKLVRIMVNVPNTVSLDKEWHLDIKKATVHPPQDIRIELKRIADAARKQAVEVYRQIGKKKKNKSEKEDIPVWVSHKWNGKRSYQINREHPLIKTFISGNEEQKGKALRLLRLIEETLPLPMIVINESENQDNQSMPFEGKALADLIVMALDFYQSLCMQGFSHESAIAEVLRTEPFNHYPELTEHMEQKDN